MAPGANIANIANIANATNAPKGEATMRVLAPGWDRSCSTLACWAAAGSSVNAMPMPSNASATMPRAAACAGWRRQTNSHLLPDLPPRTEIVHRIESGREERSFLEAARRSAVQRVAQMSSDPSTATSSGQAAFHVLAELTRLRLAACASPPATCSPPVA